MTRNKYLNLLGQFLLLTATMAWGTSFTILKDTIDSVPMFFVLAVRFLVSSVLLFLIFFKRILKTDKKLFLCGLLLGLVLYMAYVTQTLGLERTTPGKNAFLTSLYCVLVPFLMWLFFKERPKLSTIIAGILCFIGVGFVALSTDVGSNGFAFIGELLTVVCAFFYAFQLIIIEKLAKNYDGIVVLFLMLLVSGVLFAVSSLIFELPKGTENFILNTDQILKILYLTLVCTLYAQFAQIYGQKLTLPSEACIILSLEAVFGVVFSIIMGKEEISALLIVGFVLIFFSIVLCELKPDLSKFNKRINRFTKK